MRACGLCRLEQDLKILPDSDKTEIGEKGINLSGGQKQRVSIARALYSDPDIVIFDDPLSALDAHVGEHVFTQAVQEMLVARGKTVIMATHQLQYLKFAHKVLLIKGVAGAGSRVRGPFSPPPPLHHPLYVFPRGCGEWDVLWQASPVSRPADLVLWSSGSALTSCIMSWTVHHCPCVSDTVAHCGTCSGCPACG